VELAQDEQGLACIDRIVIVADVGILVTPDLVRAQLEGGSLFGLSAALWGRITLHEGAVVEHNFDGYPILRIRHAPPVEVVLLDSDQPPSGVGEVATTTTIAPALVNALAVLLGQRFRSLPLAEHVKFGSPNRRSRQSRPRRWARGSPAL